MSYLRFQPLSLISNRMKGTQETCYRQKAVGSPEQKFRDLQGGAQAQFYQVSGRDKPIPLGLTQQKSTGGQRPNPQLKQGHLVSTESMDEHNKYGIYGSDVRLH